MHAVALETNNPHVAATVGFERFGGRKKVVAAFVYVHKNPWKHTLLEMTTGSHVAVGDEMGFSKPAQPTL